MYFFVFFDFHFLEQPCTNERTFAVLYSRSTPCFIPFGVYRHVHKSFENEPILIISFRDVILCCVVVWNRRFRSRVV